MIALSAVIKEALVTLTKRHAKTDTKEYIIMLTELSDGFNMENNQNMMVEK